ncbi:hypothetical protein SAY86_007727 [Trapa natans]|uniref:RING-type domain-containing protein n=1 Tax=Trapa natans TaxID=22666 RepID=A0AAN7LHW8_TRANT|nr:hypothetical protein SAY86_007727 [Trapa natans]
MRLSNALFAIIAVLSALIIAILYNYVFSRLCRERSDSTTTADVERGSTWTDSVSALIPSCKYSSSDRPAAEERTCSVCLGEFKDGEDVRILPRCLHPFHVPCVDMWLYSHPDCPVCRTSTGLSVPISRQLETETSETSRSMVSSFGSSL